MHVKESVKDFVHGVKRKFSQKHKRDSCSTCAADSYDGASSDSSVDSHCHLETTRYSVSSSSISSLPGTLERSRFIPFVRPRTPSTSSMKHPHNVLHKAGKLSGRRSRFFSLGVSHSNHSHATSETQLGIQGSPGLIRDAANEVGTIGSSQMDYTDVIDISARSVQIGSVEESTQSSLHHTSSLDSEAHSDTSRTLVTTTSGSGHTKFVSGSHSCFDTVDSHSYQVHDIVPLVSSPPHDISSVSVSQFDIETHSESSGTLITVASGPKSVSESHSRSDMFGSYSDRNTLPLASSPPLIYPMAEASEVPPVPPPKSEKNVLPIPHAAADSSREEMITLAHSASPSSPPPVANLDTSTAAPSLSPPAVPQASRTTTPAQPINSTFGSPAPVYIPRLTAPSMFLPIPNTDPLGALLIKYVPADQRPRRDVVGEYAGRDVHEMVMSNSWRALAKMARDIIVASDPEDLGRILDLWSLRLSSLARLRLTNQASAECTNLFAVLNAVPPTSIPGSFPGSGSLPPSTPLPSSPAPAASLPLSPSGLSGLAQLPGTPSQKPSTLPPLLPGGSAPATEPRQGTNELVHPFELTMFHARVHYWSGDPLGYVDALSRILGRCKEKAREEGRVVVQRRELGRAVRARGGGDVEGTSRSERRNGDEDKTEGGDEGKGAVEEGTEVAGAQDEEEEPDEGTNQSEQANEDDDKMKDEGEDEDTAEEDTDDTEIQDKEGGPDEDTSQSEPANEDKGRTEDEESDDVLAAAEANLSMWLERIARVCLILASQLVEMNDYQAAINLLVPLCTHRVPPTFLPTPSLELHSALARIYLLSGNIQKAEEHFSIAASAAENGANGTDIVVMNTALLATASGDWTRAEVALEEMVAKDPANFTAINNLAVTLLCRGRIKEGINLLETALKTSPSSVVVAEPFLFNLSTLYELRSAAAIDKKRELLIEVAKWSGDGLRTSCLKMPSS